MNTDIELIQTLREHFDPTKPDDEDQTASSPAECAIEWILRKK